MSNKNKRLNIGLVGWNGKKNIGDDVMTSVIIQYFLKWNYKIDFELFSSDKILNEYSSGNIQLKGLKFYDFFNKKALRRIGYHFLLPKFFTRNKDIILFGGGSIFHRKGTSLTFANIIKSAKKKNRKIIIGAIGVSLGPFKTDLEYELVKENISNMDFIVVRDQRSYEILTKMAVKTPYKKAPDLAFLMPKYSGLNWKMFEKSKNILGVSLRANHISNIQLEEFSGFINDWLDLNSENKVKLFNFSELRGQNDHLLSCKLKNLIRNTHNGKVEVVRYSYNPLAFYKEIAACELMLSVRLHASIVSFSVGTIPIVVPYHQKCIDLANDLNLPMLDNSTVINKSDIAALISKAVDYKNKLNFDEVAKQAENHFYFLDQIKNRLNIRE